MSDDLIWWVSVFDVPAMAGLLALIWRVKRESHADYLSIRSDVDRKFEKLKEALTGFKLEVAKHYASQGDLRTLESRLVGHLLRIESKLDATALKAEAASHQKEE